VRSAAHLQVTGGIVHQHGDAVAAPEPEPAQQVRALVGAHVEFGIGHRLAGRGHDVSGLVRRRLRVMHGMHHTAARIAASATSLSPFARPIVTGLSLA